MVSIKKNLANFITLGNLICGIIAIFLICNVSLSWALNFGEYSKSKFNFGFNFGLSLTSIWSFGLLILAAVLDFFDGFVARLIKADGAMGKQLDSLADLVSFGLAPAIIWWHYFMASSGVIDKYTATIIAVFFVCCGAWRLAKFNVSENQSTEFLGTPIPISGLCVASVFLLGASDDLPKNMVLILNYIGAYFPVLVGLFMVSNIPMLSLKFKKAAAINKYKFVLIGLLIIITIAGKFAAGIFIYITYILWSIIANFATKNKITNG